MAVVVIGGLRVDRVGFLGYDRAATPELDRLAGGSQVFEDARATSGWTVPSLILTEERSPVYDREAAPSEVMPLRAPG